MKKKIVIIGIIIYLAYGIISGYLYGRDVKEKEIENKYLTYYNYGGGVRQSLEKIINNSTFYANITKIDNNIITVYGIPIEQKYFKEYQIIISNFTVISSKNDAIDISELAIGDRVAITYISENSDQYVPYTIENVAFVQVLDDNM